MPDEQERQRILVVGCGNMGTSHAMAYHSMEGFEICGLVSPGNSKKVLNEKLGNAYDLYDTFEEGLRRTVEWYQANREKA